MTLPIYQTSTTHAQLAKAATLMIKNMPAIQEATKGPNALIGSGPEVSTGPWVFTGTNDNKPFKDPLNTSRCAIAISAWHSWTTSYLNTTRYPILQVSIYADSTRADSVGKVAKFDAQEKAGQVFNIIDPVLNDKSHKILNWNGVPIIDSYLNRGPDIGPVPGDTNEGLYILTAYYNVQTY